jgi:hypothetical protein
MSCEVELYFYDEQTPAERAAFEAHLPGCAACRVALAELRAMRTALEPLRGEADRLRGTGEPGERLRGMGAAGERDGFEWRAFMRRLDRRLDAEGGQASSRRPIVIGILALAASLAIGIVAGVLWQREQARRAPESLRSSAQSAALSDLRSSAQSAALSDPRSSAQSAAADPRSSAVAAAADHFERAKIVLLGLANKDAATTGSTDWSYERALAASLLPDTRLHRLAALDAGEPELADLLNDLEVLLLQASLASDPDRATLARLQRYINRRDLLVRMEIGL